MCRNTFAQYKTTQCNTPHLQDMNTSTYTRAHTHRIEEEIRLETRRIALVAKTHRLQISILDKRALVRTAMATIKKRKRQRARTHTQEDGRGGHRGRKEVRQRNTEAPRSVDGKKGVEGRVSMGAFCCGVIAEWVGGG